MERYIDGNQKRDAQYRIIFDAMPNMISQFVFFLGMGTLAIMVPGALSGRQVDKLIVAASAFVLTTLLSSIILVSLLLPKRKELDWIAFILSIVISTTLVICAHRTLDVSAYVLSASFGLSLFGFALIFRGDEPRLLRDASSAAGAIVLTVTVFTPFIAARWLLTDYSFMEVGGTFLVSIIIFAVIAGVVYLPLWQRWWKLSMRVYCLYLAVIAVGLVSALQALPTSFGWLNAAYLAGLLSGLILLVGMFLGYLILLLASFVYQQATKQDPEQQIVSILLMYALFDLEFGAAWRGVDLIVPRPLNDRDLRRWLRHRLAGIPVKSRRIDRDMKWERIDPESLMRIAERLDGIIWLFRYSIPSSLRVLHSVTNDAVRNEIDRIVAALSNCQRSVLLRDAKPYEVARNLLANLEAAVTNQLGRFIKENNVAADPNRAQRAGKLAIKIIVALTPLAAAIAMRFLFPDITTVAQGVFDTFAVTWLVASVIRALDPKAEATLNLADKIGSITRPHG
ncbi:MAG: hypothetical protein M3460_10870 [Actinomycetota bacterium]|nr:hypothetical protein [Actinomycetota bacterium]